MTIASIGGGQQTDNGNASDPRLQTQGDVASYAAAATLTAADVVTGIIVASGTTYTLTLPTAALLDATFTAAKKDSSFDFTILVTASGTITLAAGTGVTAVGTMTSATATATRFRLRKTNLPNETSAWSVYRLG